MRLLHIVATPREATSNTLRVSGAFLTSVQARYPGLTVETIELFGHDLPAVAGDNIESKYSLMMGQPIDKRHRESWKQIESEIARFMRADLFLLSVPMWNFSIPYTLKYYIDAIVQPGYLFKYDELGRPLGLATGKKMVCVTSRGSDYSAVSPQRAYDFQEPYLQTIFNFVGITDLHFISAQPMDVNLDLREAALLAAVKSAGDLAAGHDWEYVEASKVSGKPRQGEPATSSASSLH